MAGYLQFPLCALAFGSSHEERLNHVLAYGLVYAGTVMSRKLDSDILLAKADALANDGLAPDDFDPSDQEHLAAVLGAKEIRGIRFGAVAHIVQQWRTLTAYQAAFETRHPGTVYVRIDPQFIFEARENRGRGISYREFAVLSAVYSIIGDKDKAQIFREAIQCRMLGYKDQDTLEAELPSRSDGQKPLDDRQIKYTLDVLANRGFFARRRAPERRWTWYSHRLTQDKLDHSLLDRAKLKAAKTAERQRRSAIYDERVRAIKSSHIKVDKTIKVDNPVRNPRNEPVETPVSVSTGTSTQCPHSVHPNKNGPNKNGFNRNPESTASPASQAPRVPSSPSLEEIISFSKECDSRVGRIVGNKVARQLMRSGKHLGPHWKDDVRSLVKEELE